MGPIKKKWHGVTNRIGYKNYFVLSEKLDNELLLQIFVKRKHEIDTWVKMTGSMPEMRLIAW